MFLILRMLALHYNDSYLFYLSITPSSNTHFLSSLRLPFSLLLLYEWHTYFFTLLSCYFYEYCYSLTLLCIISSSSFFSTTTTSSPSFFFFFTNSCRGRCYSTQPSITRSHLPRKSIFEFRARSCCARRSDQMRLYIPVTLWLFSFLILISHFDAIEAKWRGGRMLESIAYIWGGRRLQTTVG